MLTPLNREFSPPGFVFSPLLPCYTSLIPIFFGFLFLFLSIDFCYAIVVRGDLGIVRSWRLGEVDSVTIFRYVQFLKSFFFVFLHLQVVQKNLLGRGRLWRMESEEVVLLYSVQGCCYGVSRVLVG